MPEVFQTCSFSGKVAALAAKKIALTISCLEVCAIGSVDSRSAYNLLSSPTSFQKTNCVSAETVSTILFSLLSIVQAGSVRESKDFHVQILIFVWGQRSCM